MPTTIAVRRRLLVLVAALVLSSSGCQGRGDLGRVTGTITLDGEPLADAAVEFVPQGNGTTSYGRTEADGTYYMMFNRSLAGAQIGENVVRITTRDVHDENGREVWTPERVPTKYNVASELRVTVEPGDNEFDFELETAGGEIPEQREIPY